MLLQGLWASLCEWRERLPRIVRRSASRAFLLPRRLASTTLEDFVKLPFLAPSPDAEGELASFRSELEATWKSIVTNVAAMVSARERVFDGVHECAQTMEALRNVSGPAARNTYLSARKTLRDGIENLFRLHYRDAEEARQLRKDYMKKVDRRLYKLKDSREKVGRAGE